MNDVAARLLTGPRTGREGLARHPRDRRAGGLDHGAAVPAFGGGTSLSKGWGLIKRFSEDIDFKVAMPPASRNKARNERSAYRERILAALTDAGFTLDRRTGSSAMKTSFFSADFFYPSLFVTGPGLRPHIRVEMILKPPTLPPIATADRLADRHGAAQAAGSRRSSSASIRSRPRRTN